MAKRKCPPADAEKALSEIPTSHALEGFDEVIERTRQKLTIVAETGAVLRDNKVILVPSPLQRAILRALAGRALTRDQLAEEICGGHGNRLYRHNEMQELMQLGLVENRRIAGGYYRPDDPPPSTLTARI